MVTWIVAIDTPIRNFDFCAFAMRIRSGSGYVSPIEFERKAGLA